MKEPGGEEAKHQLNCPDCGQWFDMRDLQAVFEHQHWLAEKPEGVTCSYVRERGNEKEFFVWRNKKFITLRLGEGGKPY